MMPVSPWFYTNMPGFDKNWLWRGGFCCSLYLSPGANDLQGMICGETDGNKFCGLSQIMFRSYRGMTTVRVIILDRYARARMKPLGKSLAILLSSKYRALIEYMLLLRREILGMYLHIERDFSG